MKLIKDYEQFKDEFEEGVAECSKQKQRAYCDPVLTLAVIDIAHSLSIMAEQSIEGRR